MFDYSKAFSRNIGWVTQQEQAQLRSSRVAIAGMGGVGGAHLLTLTRMGVGKFHIADFDHFDLANFNRQAGASMASLGQPKVEVLAAMARDINPEVEIRVFAGGVDRMNLPDFLGPVDLYVDGLDFFAFSARQDTFAACASRRIPAITAAPTIECLTSPAWRECALGAHDMRTISWWRSAPSTSSGRSSSPPMRRMNGPTGAMSGRPTNRTGRSMAMLSAHAV